jgi:Leucine-rich repeat (LRR) protein
MYRYLSDLLNNRRRKFEIHDGKIYTEPSTNRALSHLPLYKLSADVIESIIFPFLCLGDHMRLGRTCRMLLRFSGLKFTHETLPPTPSVDHITRNEAFKKMIILPEDVNNKQFRLFCTYAHGLVHLQVISLALTNITPLSTFVRIHTLRLDCERLEQLKVLSNIPTIQSLELRFCTMINIKGLINMSQLRTLRIVQCPRLKDVSALKHLPTLDNLSLSECEKLRHIGVINSIPHLYTLDLSHCRMVDVNTIGTSYSLHTLDLHCCTNLIDVSALSHISTLRIIDFFGCYKLKDVSALRNLPELHQLNLGRCHRLVDVSPLTELPKLHTLSLYSCFRLKDISMLSNCPSLHTVDLTLCHKLRCVSSLNNSRTIKVLYVRYCSNLIDLMDLVNIDTVHS